MPFIFLALTLSCCAEPPLAAPTAQQIRDFWFSGAELNRYELTQFRYGQQHPGHAEFIFVTEPFDLADQVKSDRGGAGTTPVLKLNALRTFNTGLYSYRTMLSVFTPTEPLAAPHALKETLSVQDWCGQIFMQLNREDDAWRLRSFSYFQSEGDADRAIVTDGAWLEEDFFNAVRLNPTSLPVGNFRAMPSQLYFRFHHREPAVHDAVGELTDKDEAVIYTVRYPELDRAITITFDQAFPHIIREWTEGTTKDPRQTVATLTHRQMQIEYWRLHNSEHRGLRTDLGLNPVAN